MASSRISLFVFRSSSSYMNNNNCKFSPIISLNPSSSLQVLHEPYSWRISRRGHNRSCRDLVVHSGVDPAGAGLPPLSNWKSWVLGMAITVILPFLRQKLGPFLILTSRVENVVDKAEAVAEMIEKTAEAVERVAEEISDDLPEGGNKLRNAVDFVQTLAKETAKDAHLAHDLIDQVQNVEDVVENIIHTDKEDIN